MRYGSVCSGIEAASVAWEPLGWNPAWFAEVEPFPSAVLTHHWPEVDNLGDMTRISRRVLLGEVEAPDVLVGGTPCQAFSVAGMREGMADDRGQLTMKYVELADAIDAVRLRAGNPESIIVWENVPGVLSDRQNAFGCFLGALAGEDRELQPAGKRWTNAGCVYGPARAIAWRVLDAQYFGVAQRRRRVFVVASARDGFDPAAVLLEREGVRRDSAPRREAGQGAAAHAGGRIDCTGDGITGTVSSKWARGTGGPAGDEHYNLTVVQAVTGDITHALNTANNGKGCSEDGTGRGVPTIAFTAKDYGADAQADLSPTLRAGGHAASHANAGVMPAVCFVQNSRSEVRQVGGDGQITGAIAAAPGVQQQHYVAQPVAFQPGNLRRGAGAPPSVDVFPTVKADHGRGLSDQFPHVCQSTADTLISSWHKSVGAKAGKEAGVLNPVFQGLRVRRLMPVECERLQGFPDDHTLIPDWYACKCGHAFEEALGKHGCPNCCGEFTARRKTVADGPRYKAIGNSMAVPCMAWIGRRIEMAAYQAKEAA